MINRKRQRGEYYTHGNPFQHIAFTRWSTKAGLPKAKVLEPFAGSNNIIKILVGMGACNKFSSYDIAPTDSKVKARDTLKNFPSEHRVCITNPPWLAKNSATFRGLPFPDCSHDDIYKLALEKCLSNCEYVAALVPESFITADIYQDRLNSFVSLTSEMFRDTNHPVGLAMFSPNKTKDVLVWSGMKIIGKLSELKAIKPSPIEGGIAVEFNKPDGNVGLIALDNTFEPSIRFCDVSELKHYKVKQTGRHITKLDVHGNVKISEWNHLLNGVRKNTHDVLMTCYKGIRHDGMYRRRCDWSLARGIIQNVG